MKEIILNKRKNGMAMLLLFVALLLAAIAAIIFGASYEMYFLMIAGIVWVTIGWIPLCGLKVIAPQEALVDRKSVV